MHRSGLGFDHCSQHLQRSYAIPQVQCMRLHVLWICEGVDTAVVNVRYEKVGDVRCESLYG